MVFKKCYVLVLRMKVAFSTGRVNKMILVAMKQRCCVYSREARRMWMEGWPGGVVGLGGGCNNMPISGSVVEWGMPRILLWYIQLSPAEVGVSPAHYHLPCAYTHGIPEQITHHHHHYYLISPIQSTMPGMWGRTLQDRLAATKSYSEVRRKEWVLRRLQQLRSYLKKTEIQTQEEIPFSSQSSMGSFCFRRAIDSPPQCLIHLREYLAFTTFTTILVRYDLTRIEDRAF